MKDNTHNISFIKPGLYHSSFDVFPKVLHIMILFWNSCQPHTPAMCRAWFIIFFVAQSKGETSKIGDINGCLLRTSVMAFRFQLNKCESMGHSKHATIAKHEELFSQTLKLFTTSPIFFFSPIASCSFLKNAVCKYFTFLYLKALARLYRHTHIKLLFKGKREDVGRERVQASIES